MSTALSDDRGVGARVVEILQTPSKTRVKVIFGGEAAADIHKGAAGDPALLVGDLHLCVDGTIGLFTTAGRPWRTNTERVATYRAAAGASGENELRKATVRPGKSARWIAHVPGGLDLLSGAVQRPPERGALEVTIANGNDGSFHRLCANLETAEAVQDRTIAGGSGRKITWRNAGPDPGCVRFDELLPVICSPSGAFLDGAGAAFF